MALKELREMSGLSRKELAERSGVNLRSIQDYEQGHKDISRAKGETLYRLSLAIGCTVEQLLADCLTFREVADDRDADHFPKPQLPKAIIQDIKIFSAQYKIYGRWQYDGEVCNLIFLYEGQLIRLPFAAEFTEKTLPWLMEAAVMKIESFIEEDRFQKVCREHGEGETK